MTLDIAQIIPIGGVFILITAIDRHDNNISGKFFATKEEAMIYSHKASKANMPRWHERHCEVCKKETL